MRLYPIVNTLAAQARVFHGFAMLRRKKERTRGRRSYMRTLSHGGNTTRRGRFLPNEPNRRNALSVKELSVRAPSHTVLPSVVALIRPVRVSVIYFASPRITGVSFMPPCIFPAIYREAGLDERSDIRERFLPHAAALMRATVSPKTRRR